MYELLVRLMLIAALGQAGMSLAEFANCRSMQCLQKIEKNMREVTRIQWKPIVIFPEEAKRFQ